MYEINPWGLINGVYFSLEIIVSINYCAQSYVA